MQRSCLRSLGSLRCIVSPASTSYGASSLLQSVGPFQVYHLDEAPLTPLPFPTALCPSSSLPWRGISNQSEAVIGNTQSREDSMFSERPELQGSETQFSFEGARVPLNRWQQAAVAVGSAVGAFMNPARADLVAALGETTGAPAFQNLLDRMKRNPEGIQILKDRPRVISSAVGHAWDMPANTFGAAYAKFMGSRNFSPDDRPPVRFMESEELAYVATRAREVHDFWHVLFNCPTSVVGELALKMVEFQQTLLPMCFLSVAGASWRLKPEQRAVLFGHYGPWAVKAGRSASDLICIYYEKYLDQDLEEVRKKWGIVPAPPRPKTKVL